MSIVGQLNKSNKGFKRQDSKGRKWSIPALVCADCNHAYPAYATEYNYDSVINKEMGKCNGEAISQCPYCVEDAEVVKVMIEIDEWDAEQNKPLTEEEIVLSEFEDEIHEYIQQFNPLTGEFE